MLEFARLRPVRGIRGARPIPRQDAGIVFFPKKIMCIEDGALEGAGRGVFCRWWGRCGGCAAGRMNGRVDSDRYHGIGGWEEEKDR